MSAVDLLASINTRPYHATTNPGGLADSGYLVTDGGVTLVARAVRAMGEATADVQLANISGEIAEAQARNATLLALAGETASSKASAQQQGSDAQAAQSGAEAARDAAVAARAAALAAAQSITPAPLRFGL